MSRPVLGALSLRAKQPGDEADHSPPRCGDYLNIGKALSFYIQDEALYFQVYHSRQLLCQLLDTTATLLLLKLI